MTNERLPDPPGRWVEIPQSSQLGLAFVPAPLPLRFPVSGSTVHAIGEVRALIGRLCEGIATLPSPELFLRPFRAREAVLSSRIEGTKTTLEAAFVHELDGAERARIDDDLEVQNYRRALGAGMSSLSAGRPLTVYLLRDLHRDLLRGVRGEQKRPGEFRDAQVWIGALGGSSPDVRFVPPPSLQVAQCLEGLDQYLAARGTFEGLVRIALAHYQFEAIHPFFDGNGRIGRLLLTVQMVWEGVLDSACLFLSPALERRRQDYYDRLLAVSRDGDFAGWIAFFLDIVRESAIETLDRLRRLRALQEEFTRRLRAVQSPKPALLVPELFGLPFVNVPRAQRLLGCMPKTAQGAIEKLVALGILQQVDSLRREGRGRPSNLYRCGEVLDIVRE